MQGLSCTRKQVEISEILHKNNIDLLAIQESWEVTGKSKVFCSRLYMVLETSK